MSKTNFTLRGKGLKFLSHAVCKTSTPTTLNGLVAWLKLVVSIQQGLMIKISYVEYLVFFCMHNLVLLCSSWFYYAYLVLLFVDQYCSKFIHDQTKEERWANLSLYNIDGYLLRKMRNNRAPSAKFHLPRLGEGLAFDTDDEGSSSPTPSYLVGN
jgi:hypothetical protein